MDYVRPFPVPMRNKLIELLTHQLRWANQHKDIPLFYNTWKVLWAMGANVHLSPEGDITISHTK